MPDGRYRRVDDAAVADLFEELADLLELGGVNPFKVRAYRRAAEAIRALDERLASVRAAGRLGQVEGLGEAIVEKIEAALDTGRIPTLERARADTSVDVSALRRIPGLGPKKLAALHAALGIRTLDDLDQALRHRRIRTVTGFSEAMDERIREGRAPARAPQPVRVRSTIRALTYNTQGRGPPGARVILRLLPLALLLPAAAAQPVELTVNGIDIGRFQGDGTVADVLASGGWTLEEPCLHAPDGSRLCDGRLAVDETARLAAYQGPVVPRGLDEPNPAGWGLATALAIAGIFLLTRKRFRAVGLVLLLAGATAAASPLRSRPIDAGDGDVVVARFESAQRAGVVALAIGPTDPPPWLDWAIPAPPLIAETLVGLRAGDSVTVVLPRPLEAWNASYLQRTPAAVTLNETGTLPWPGLEMPTQPDGSPAPGTHDRAWARLMVAELENGTWVRLETTTGLHYPTGIPVQVLSAGAEVIFDANSAFAGIQGNLTIEVLGIARAPPQGPRRVDLTLEAADGSIRRLPPDQPVLVMTMATWCLPCIERVPAFQNLAADHPDVALAWVDVDPTETRTVVRSFAARANVTWPILLDPRGEFLRETGVVTLTTAVLIDADGRIVWTRREPTLEQMEQALAEHVPDAPP